MVDGYNSAIARNLCISTSTVKTHVRNILRKLYVSDRPKQQPEHPGSCPIESLREKRMNTNSTVLETQLNARENKSLAVLKSTSTEEYPQTQTLGTRQQTLF